MIDLSRKNVEVSYSHRRGGSVVHSFRLGVSADEVQEFVMRRFLAREDTTVRMGKRNYRRS